MTDTYLPDILLAERYCALAREQAAAGNAERADELRDKAMHCFDRASKWLEKMPRVEATDG